MEQPKVRPIDARELLRLAELLAKLRDKTLPEALYDLVSAIAQGH